MPEAVCGSEFTNALLDVLGLDGREITKLVLVLEVGKIIKVRVTENATPRGIGAFRKITGRYVLSKDGQ